MPQEFHLSSESEKLKRSIIELLASKPKGDTKFAIVQFYVNKILKIDDVNESVSLDFYLKVNWQSEHWKGKTDDDFQKDEDRFASENWWEPGVEVTNAIDLQKLVDKEEAFWLEIPEDGILAYTQRFIGSVNVKMKLHNFPFDSQIFTIQFESFHWKAEDCQLLVLETHKLQLAPKTNESWLSMNKEVQLNEWNIEGITVAEKLVHYDFEDRDYSQVLVCIYAKRKSGYFVWKLMSILLLIVVITWIAFLIPPENLADRMSIVVTLFLSAVAFNFVGSSSIPKVSYLTQFDIYMISAYFLIVLVVFENMISYLYETNIGKKFFSVFNVVDAISIVLFPLGTLLMHLLYVAQFKLRRQGFRPLQAKRFKGNYIGPSVDV